MTQYLLSLITLIAPIYGWAQLNTQDMGGQVIGGQNSQAPMSLQNVDPAQLRKAMQKLNLSEDQKKQLLMQLQTVQKNVMERDKAMQEFFENEERLKNKKRKNSY
ncbi:MAG: hypothetical protein CL677_06920 [Bdellovibrionaceae bacterium]|nr:hypothetical protein [Pseudobdellovibrionaceae bacterium]|tara:strand:- start:22298 stop:22612 length:315 start_codon:yes stop_codon:yes gene_type:complete